MFLAATLVGWVEYLVRVMCLRKLDSQIDLLAYYKLHRLSPVNG